MSQISRDKYLNGENGPPVIESSPEFGSVLVSDYSCPVQLLQTVQLDFTELVGSLAFGITRINTVLSIIALFAFTRNPLQSKDRNHISIGQAGLLSIITETNPLLIASVCLNES